MYLCAKVGVGLSCVMTLILGAIVFAPISMAQPPGVSASLSGPGAAGGGGIYADSQFQFDIYVNNTQPSNIEAMASGFQVYSPDGASWQPIVIDTFPIGWPIMFNLAPFLTAYAGVTGSGADSAMGAAVAMPPLGWPAGMGAFAWYIPTVVSSAEIGRTLCIDSCWMPPGNQWQWILTGSIPYFPAWGGPYCFTIESDQPDSCDYYKPAYEDYAPNGVPDFDQKQDAWIYQPSGAWSYCGPVALANCLWWFDSKFEPAPLDPRPFYPDPGHVQNDGYNLVYPFGPASGWDDHDTNNVMPFIDSLALYCKTNQGHSGTNVFDLATGAQAWIDSAGLTGDFVVNIYPMDPAFGFDFIREQVLASQNVILLLGFYEEVGGDFCERVGGHFVTVAGTCTDPADSCLCISDPYYDMHEGEPPAGSAHGSSVHNDAANISGPHGSMYHDKYSVITTQCTPSGPLPFLAELANYGVNAGNIAVWQGQNLADTTLEPMPPQGGPIHTLLEWAVVICPAPPDPTGACCEPPYGLCHIMTEAECDDAGWLYEGDGTTCTPNPCDSCDYQNPGDVNDDGFWNISDLTYLISFLYISGPAPPVLANADVNGDCCIGYDDIIYLIEYLFNGGPAPVNCTCVDPPICLPAPPPHTPGIVKHNTNSYLPPD
ncbi:MAG: dockerin type I repeat-containing protein, partial [candidate division Zixibacteria bacterium]|nr:dockerin type I repeat-containing protein [candidate division Zixibacteria bacterium]